MTEVDSFKSKLVEAVQILTISMCERPTTATSVGRLPDSRSMCMLWHLHDENDAASHYQRLAPNI